MTYRYYLQDMAYAVALQVPEPMAHEITQALTHPAWDLYLGRKTCVPSEFIYQGIFDSASEALNAGQSLAREKKRAFTLRVLQGEHFGEVITLNDVPLQFGAHKQYQERRVTLQKTE